MIGRSGLGAAVAAALLLLNGGVQAAEMEIKGLRLGMSLPEGEIEEIYQAQLAAEVEDSVGLSFPYYHIETSLIDGTRLGLHFSSPADGTRLFWIRHTRSWRWPIERTPPDLASLLADLEARFGTPTRRVGPTDGTASLLLVYAMPDSAPLPDRLDLAPVDAAGVQFYSFQERVELLGAAFVGAVATIVVAEGEVAAAVEELVDHRRATTVLNPGP